MSTIDKLRLANLKYHYRALKATCSFSFDKSLAMRFAEDLANVQGRGSDIKRKFYIAYIRNWVSFYWNLSPDARPTLTKSTQQSLYELGFDEPKFL